MISLKDITGVILAGGESQRMGFDKALLTLNDETFISKIYKVLSSLFEKVIIAANDKDKYNFLDIPVLEDIYSDAGPLAGLHSAISYVTTSHIFLIPCDLPLINSNVINLIVEKAIYNTINIIKDGNNVSPLVGIYPVSMTNLLDKFLRQGKRKVFDFLNSELIKYQTLDLTEYSEYLVNINFAFDYEQIKL
jgi:molybdopterin-guanine dinucleotide biosynthesis protein A